MNANDHTSYGEQVQRALDTLFKKAKSVDEFEYACTLLRIRGYEDVGWDPLVETSQLVNDLMGLIGGPLKDITRLRLALLAYCHVTEVDAIYGILENMLLTTEGERCSVWPFSSLYQGRKKNLFSKPNPPSAKRVITFLKEHAVRLGEKDLVEILDAMFDEDVRNSFFHSDYVIHKSEYRTREGRFTRSNVIKQSIELSDLSDLINRGLTFYQTFMDVYWRHIKSYEQPKLVEGRFVADGTTRVPIQLMATPEHGLHGFRTPPSEGSGARGGEIEDPRIENGLTKD